METEFEIEKENMEVLKILGLTNPEIKVFLKILISKSTIPIEISEISGISKNKIYGIFKTLAEKGFLHKNPSGYEVNPESLNRLKSQYAELFRSFNNFIERIIENFPVTDDVAVKKIMYVFSELGYDVEFSDRVDNSVLEDTPFRARHHRFENLLMPWLIVGASPTSGRKIGVVITLSRFSRQVRGDAYYMLRELSLEYETDAIFIVGMENVDLPGRIRNEFSFFNILSNYDKNILEKLENFDRRWQQTKETLVRLENKIEEPYKSASRLTTWLSTLRYEIKDSASNSNPWLFKSFEEIVDRIDGDLKTDTDVCLNLKFNFKEMQSLHRHNKIIPSEEKINSFTNQIVTINQDLERLGTETRKLYDEIDSVFREDIYKKFGYIANPFVFTIPVENHLEMVRQKKAMEQLSNFIHNMTEIDETKNVTFIVDEPGMGKTHLMKYFQDKMNKENFANAIGIFIRCKADTDLLSIYSQIQLGVSQLEESNLKDVLLSILKEKSQPLTVNELTEILREISYHMYQKTKKHFFLFIDEFENMIPTTNESKTALLQLRNLIQTPHVGFVIVLRKDYWEKDDLVQKTIPENTYQILKIERFDETLTKLLLEKRLRMFSQMGPSQILFDEESIKKITEKSKGNIRHTITLARDAFRKDIQRGVNVITPELLIEDKQTTLLD